MKNIKTDVCNYVLLQHRMPFGVEVNANVKLFIFIFHLKINPLLLGTPVVRMCNVFHINEANEYAKRFIETLLKI